MLLDVSVKTLTNFVELTNITWNPGGMKLLGSINVLTKETTDIKNELFGIWLQNVTKI